MPLTSPSPQTVCRGRPGDFGGREVRKGSLPFRQNCGFRRLDRVFGLRSPRARAPSESTMCLALLASFAVEIPPVAVLRGQSWAPFGAIFGACWGFGCFGGPKVAGNVGKTSNPAREARREFLRVLGIQKWRKTLAKQAIWRAKRAEGFWVFWGSQRPRELEMTWTCPPPGISKCALPS